MGAAEQIQLVSLRHLFYLIGYGRIVGHSQVGRLPHFVATEQSHFGALSLPVGVREKEANAQISPFVYNDAQAPSDTTRIEQQGPYPN